MLFLPVRGSYGPGQNISSLLHETGQTPGQCPSNNGMQKSPSEQPRKFLEI